LQGQEDLILQDYKHYDGENMKKDEDGGLNEKLNQDNTVIELNMNHCSRRPRCTRSWVFMPCEHLKLTGLLGYRRAPPLHRELHHAFRWASERETLQESGIQTLAGHTQTARK
jgi:hypothetical protein